jgi:hypothetical protein
MTDSTELSFEMRTTSGGDIDCSLVVWNKFEYPMGHYYQGLSYQGSALFALREAGGVERVYSYGGGSLTGWHDFRWARDAEGWWSLYLDGVNVYPDFAQDLRLTSFISADIGTPNAQVEWVRLTAGVIPAPAALVLGGIGVSLAGWLRRRRVL